MSVRHKRNRVTKKEAQKDMTSQSINNKMSDVTMNTRHTYMTGQRKGNAIQIG